MAEFYRTVMGRKFYEKDLPSLTLALERIAKQMELQNIREEKKFKLEEKLMKKQIRDINESSTKNKKASVNPDKVIKQDPILKNKGLI